MNTKTDQISSGLVEVAWSVLNGVHTPIVRLSDAEVIINDLQNLVVAENQRKQQLEEQVAKQSAALKLASLALSEGVEYVEEPPEKNCSCHLSPPCNDCVDHSAVREFCIDARKALAAIDNALGE